MSKILTIDALNKTLIALNGGEITSTIKKGQVKRVGDRIYRAKKDITNFNERDVLDSTKFKPTYIGDSEDQFKINLFENQLSLYKSMYYNETITHNMNQNWTKKNGNTNTLIFKQFNRFTYTDTNKNMKTEKLNIKTDFNIPIEHINNIVTDFNNHEIFTTNLPISYRLDIAKIRKGNFDFIPHTLQNKLNNIKDPIKIYDTLRQANIDKNYFNLTRIIPNHSVSVLNLYYKEYYYYKVLKEHEIFEFIVYQYNSNIDNPYVNTTRDISYLSYKILSRPSSRGTIYTHNFDIINITSYANNCIKFWIPYFGDIKQYDYSNESAKEMNKLSQNKFGVGLVVNKDGYYRLNFQFIKSTKAQHDEDYEASSYTFYGTYSDSVNTDRTTECKWIPDTQYDGYIKFKCENGQISDVEFNCGNSQIDEFFRYSKVDNHIFIKVFYAIWSYDDSGGWNEWQFAHLIAPFKLYYSPTPILNNEMEGYDEISLQ